MQGEFIHLVNLYIRKIAGNNFVACLVQVNMQTGMQTDIFFLFLCLFPLNPLFHRFSRPQGLANKMHCAEPCVQKCTMLFWIPCLGPFQSLEWKCVLQFFNKKSDRFNALPRRRCLMSAVPALVLRLGSKFQTIIIFDMTLVSSLTISNLPWQKIDLSNPTVNWPEFWGNFRQWDAARYCGKPSRCGWQTFNW